jgi:hypothetical protein
MSSLSLWRLHEVRHDVVPALEEQVTLAAAVPALLQAMLNTLDDNPGHWKLADGLRIAIGGSAAVAGWSR